MKKSSPTIKNASPVGTNTATLAKPMTSMSTATGTYKLAAMKRDIKSSGSPGSSSNNSPRPENATVWKKPEDHSGSNNASPILASASTIPVSTNEKQEPLPDATTSQHERSNSATNTSTKEMSEEELVKSGIHLTQRLSTSSQRTFNWDEDDEDDWTQSLPLPEIKEPAAQPPTPKHEEESPKAAPWVNASLPKPQVVPIAEQIKQLSEQRSQRNQPPPRRGSSAGPQHHHHQPIQVGKNVPHFNYRLDSKPPSGPPADDRYRYPDFERRYRSDVPPPRQELYNANSGAVEPAWRRDKRPSHPEPAAPPPVLSAEDKKKEEAAIREKQAQVMREAREKARKRKEEEVRREEERKAAAKKKADELAARIAERERKAAEEKRQKEEEERRKKKEAEEAARRKKREEEEEEAEKKRKKKIADEEEAAAAAAEERGRTNEPGNIRSHRSKSSIDENQALRTVSSVLDDEKSEHGDKPKLWSEPASATGSRLWNSNGNDGTNNNNNNNNHGTGASPNNSTATTTAGGHRKSDELWLPVQASTNRFSSAIGRSGPTFGTKDDLVLLREQQTPKGNRWDEATNWRRAPSPPEPRENKAPGTPSKGTQAASPETTPTSGHRGMSRFFPSPQVEKSNKNSSPEGLNISPWTESPRSMLLHRESLLPSTSEEKQSSKNWSSSVNTGGSTDTTTFSSPSRPRVLLPAGENKQHSASSHNPRLPSLDSIQALQSTIAQKLGGKRLANSNMTKSTLPIPESPVVNSIEEGSIPFPPLAREERLQKMIVEKEDKRTRQLLQTQSDPAPPQQEEEEEEKAGQQVLSTKLPPTTENTKEEEAEIVLIFDKRVREPKTDSLRYCDKQGRQTQREYIVNADNPVKVSQVRMPGKSTITISRRRAGQWRSRRQ